MKYMVFDVGGTDIKYSVMDEGLNRYAEGTVPTPMESRQAFLHVLRKIYLPHKVEVEAIAVSLPGFIDSGKGRCNGGGALVYNHQQDVGPELEKICGCPVHLDNDGKCAAMAELWKGSLKGCQNACVFLIGTGVGGGLVIDGKLVKGTHFTAGEFSFLMVNANQWEDFDSTMAGQCSTTALLSLYRNYKGLPKGEAVNGKQLFERFHEGEEEARRALDTFCHNIAIQVYNLTTLLDLEKVAIGGGVSRQPVLIEKISQCVEEIYENSPCRDMGVTLNRAQVVPCHFSSEANQVGALYSYMAAKGLVNG